MPKDLIAHYQQGNSNKLYIASVRENPDSTFSVIGKWGKVGRVNQSTLKCTEDSETAAVVEQKKLFMEKLNKGYVDIDHQYYAGGVTRQSLAGILTDNSQSKPKRKKVEKVPKDPVGVDLNFVEDDVEEWADEQVCIDNHGMEDGFDEGVTYVVEHHSQDGYLYAYDKFAVKRGCSRKRFSCTGKVKGVKP